MTLYNQTHETIGFSSSTRTVNKSQIKDTNSKILPNIWGQVWLESLLWSQINSQHFNLIDKIDSRKKFLVATFHLTLTPNQKLVLDNRNSTSEESRKFLGLLEFKSNFTMQSSSYRFLIIKLVSKQLACFDGKTLQSHEYEKDNISGNVIQKITGIFFLKTSM